MPDATPPAAQYSSREVPRDDSALQSDDKGARRRNERDDWYSDPIYNDWDEV